MCYQNEGAWNEKSKKTACDIKEASEHISDLKAAPRNYIAKRKL